MRQPELDPVVARVLLTAAVAIAGILAAALVVGGWGGEPWLVLFTGGLQ